MSSLLDLRPLVSCPVASNATQTVPDQELTPPIRAVALALVLVLLPVSVTAVVAALPVAGILLWDAELGPVVIVSGACLSLALWLAVALWRAYLRPTNWDWGIRTALIGVLLGSLLPLFETPSKIVCGPPTECADNLDPSWWQAGCFAGGVAMTVVGLLLASRAAPSQVPASAASDSTDGSDATIQEAG